MIARDILIFEGKEHPLPVELLEPWFTKNGAKRPAGNGRGYWAQYGFDEEDRLVVRDLLVPDARNLRTGMRSILNETIEPEDRGITQYSGLLLLHPAYKGDKPAAFNGKGSYTVLEIRRGKLRSQKTCEATRFEAFKQEQFEYFQLTDDYETLKAAAKLAFEKQEQEARRKEDGRGYRAFDQESFDKSVLEQILVLSKELLVD